ncbi:hypothetical protein CDAR_480101 [Caerostris darwini]|uniref:Uncharacterized protein n=1 Tax=Caerostris darwini TaxID=1538125 RepID=A0AAV4T2M7_9ARAC|nr:hypothetical protein CDAR_480101 [Caerostris darwini]
MLPFKKSYRAFSLFGKEDQNILHTSEIFSEKYFCIKATFDSCHADLGFEKQSCVTSQRKNETAEEKKHSGNTFAQKGYTCSLSRIWAIRNISDSAGYIDVKENVYQHNIFQLQVFGM